MTDPTDTARNSGQQLGGLLTVVGWIGAGAIALAAVLLALDLVVDLPFSRELALVLGLAMGGGLGGVANLLREGEDLQHSDETMTVDVDPSPDTTPDPRPADLFDGHPDPVLYYAEAGHGPVVRAANGAFGETFDVPPDRLAETPLSEALLVAGQETVTAEAVTDGSLDTVVECSVPDGTAQFRLRTVGTDKTGYLLYTPVESANSVDG